MERITSLFWKRGADVSNEDPSTSLHPEGSNDDGLRSYNTQRLFHIIERKLSEQDIIDDIEACLKNGADVNGQNDTGRTVLHIAEQKNYQKVVEFLLRQGGIRRDTEACSGPTALSSAGSEQQAAGAAGIAGDVVISGNTCQSPDAPSMSKNVPVNSELSCDINIDLKELLVDIKIEYSSEKYINLLETVAKDSCSINDKLNLDPYPSGHTLALLALKAYSDIPDKLPEGWELLTTASNPDLTNGYFGAAFWCRTLQQVVVAHRGTAVTNAGAMLANYKSIISYKNSSHMQSAITFTDSIASTLTKVKKQRGGCFQLSITGHSLGGWLAQVTAFTIKYLQKNKSTFRKVRNVGDGFHAHTVVFDSPGCRTMLNKMKEKFDLRYDRSIFLRRLDISSYLSAPNRINCLNPHLGIIYRVLTDLSDVTAVDEYTAGYTLKTHSIEKMAQALSKLETPNIVKMMDWPLRSVLWGEEYNKFFKSANRKNEYHQQTDRYEFKEINKKCCSLRLFSEDELLLLDSWLILKKSKMNLTNLIKIDDLIVSDLFDEFVVDKEKQIITCSSEESIQKVIRHTKALMRWLPAEVMDATRQQAAQVPSAAEALFRAEGENYLRSLKRSRLDLRDTIELEAFLTSRSNTLIIRTSDSDMEMARFVNIFHQIKKKWEYLKETSDHYSFMNLKGIKRLESVVNIKELFQSCFTEDYLFIIQCTENYDESFETIFIQILTNLENNPNNKLIFIDSQDTDFEDFVKSSHFSQSIGNNLTSVCMEEIKLNNLTEESMKRFFEPKIICLQGAPLSWRELVGEYSLLTADQLNNVNTLIGPQMLINLLTIDNYVIEMEDAHLSHDDLKVHSTVNKEVSVARVAQALQKHYPDALLVISGIGREELETDRWRELVRALGEERIYTTAGNGEPIFKQMCREKPDSTVYWLAASAELVSCKSIYQNGFYIKRRFQKIIFDIEQFARNINTDINIQNATFVFQNIKDKQSLMMNQAKISDENKNIFLKTQYIKTVNTTEEADNIIKEISDRAVHILEQEANGDSILWQRSRGSLEGLRPYISTNIGISVDEEGLRNTTQKVIIIADEPGMGKSTSLTSVSRLLRSSAWVIRIDLKDFQIPIQELPIDLSLNSVCDFILRDEDSWLHGLLQFCLDKRNKPSREVYLLFDGFDEIKQNPSQTKNCADEVLRLLQYVNSETTARIWITTRLYRREMVENKFSIFAMRFEKISISYQREYLVKFWYPHLLLELDHYGDVEKEKLEKCAEFLYKNAKKVLGDDVQNFMGIPLQMRMLAEIFMERVKNCVESEIDIRNTFDIKSVLDLYRQFISLKYEIYFNDKTGLNAGMSGEIKQSNVELITEKHRLLGFRTLVPEFAKEHFDNPEAGWGDELCRIGLVQAGGVVGENIEFIHRTLAEYFCADLAVDWLRKKGRYHGLAPMVELLLTEILLRDVHNVIRTFINKLVLSQPLHEDADKFSALKISELWCDDVKQRSLFNENINTALHIAVREGNTGIIAILVGGLKCAPVPKGLISFIAAHDGDCYTALGRAALMADDHSTSEIVRRAGTEIIKKFIQSVETCPQEVILELLLATYARYTAETDDEIKIFGEYVRGETICAAINGAFARTQEIIREHIPRLHAAVRDSRVEEVEELYGNMESDTERRYLLLASSGEWGGTVLHRPGHSGEYGEQNKIQTQIIKMLCNQNIPEVGRSYNRFSRTPLHCAAEVGHLDMVEHLINHGVHIDSLTREGGETALFSAARGRSLSVVQYLTEKGIAIDTINNKGETALFSAVCGKSLSVAQYLIEKGIAINTLNDKGETVLFSAAVRGTLSVVQYLIDKGIAINTINDKGETALFSAACSRSLSVVQYLIEKGIAINTLNDKGETALFSAAVRGTLSIVQYLTKKGIAIDTINDKGETALFSAVCGRSLSVAQYLIEKGIAINTLNDKGETALFSVARDESLSLVQYLVEKGIAINTPNGEGETALFSAARNGSLSVVQYLIEKGIAINTLNGEGETALFSAARDGSLSVVQYLIEKGIAINTLNLKGETALFSTARDRSLSVVKYLIEKGIAINTLNDKGETALFSAAVRGSLLVVQYLIEKGIAINTLNGEGETALFSAAHSGSLPMVEYLAEKGLAITTVNNNGETVLDIVTSWGLSPIMDFLRQKLSPQTV